MITCFTLYRTQQESLSTAGELYAGTKSIRLCVTLERGAQNPDHVRIPAGKYQIVRKNIGESHFDTTLNKLLGPKYKGILWLPRVPGRTNIEVHTANFYTELEGCIALGNQSFLSAGHWMITQSRDAYTRVYPIISSAIDAGETFFDIHDPAT